MAGEVIGQAASYPRQSEQAMARKGMRAMETAELYGKMEGSHQDTSLGGRNQPAIAASAAEAQLTVQHKASFVFSLPNCCEIKH